jgi:hypothetical protein
MLFQKRHHKSRKRHAGAVQSVTEFGFSIDILKATIETPCLIIGKA